MTNDRADFTLLMEREPQHPGLVCITVAHGLMSLDVQTRLFDHTLNLLAGEAIAGRVLENCAPGRSHGAVRSLCAKHRVIRTHSFKYSVAFPGDAAHS